MVALLGCFVFNFSLLWKLVQALRISQTTPNRLEIVLVGPNHLEIFWLVQTYSKYPKYQFRINRQPINLDQPEN
jgi:hypothetical protein